MTVENAINVLSEELKNNEGYRIGWVANIAMAIKDVWNEEFDLAGVKMTETQKDQLHICANLAAENFIKNLCRQ
jgi:hypothetical protein